MPASSLRSIQYLRGLAALMVVVYHASHYLAVYRGAPPVPRLSGLGLYGVSIFFAISGYLMATLVRRTGPFVFMAHRLVRIYPTFLIVVALYGAASALLSRPFVLDWVALTLVPAGPRIYALDVEWTLLFEVSFYVALFLFSIAGWTTQLERAAVAWLGLILFGALAFPAWQGDLTPPIERLPLLEACTGFAAGLLVPAALRSGLVPRWSAVAAAASALLLLFLDLGHDRLIAGLVSAVVVAGAIRVDRGLPRVAFDPLKTLGDWSYALYLCHVPVIRLTYELAPGSANQAALWLFAVAACLAASAAIGSLDVRLYRRSKRFVDRCAAKPLRLAIGAYVTLFAALAIYGSVDTAAKTRRAAQEQAILGRIPSASLRDADAARAAIEAAGLKARDTLRGEVTEVQRLESGVLAVRGWLVDLEDPARELSLVVFHNGVQIAVARPWRRRPDVARALGRNDLATAKIGFGLGTRPVHCADAGEVVVLGLDPTGTVAVLPGKTAIAGCP
jgi:peptidoglycan/LPS O-acetylase OafA/YrhL